MEATHASAAAPRLVRLPGQAPRPDGCHRTLRRSSLTTALALTLTVAWAAALGACPDTASSARDATSGPDASPDATPDTTTDTTPGADTHHADAQPDDGGPGPAFCQGTTNALYAPLGPHAALEPQAFPDDLLTAPDPTSPTGLRLAYTPDRAAWAGATPGLLQRTAAQMGRVSGFGRTTDILLRFDAPFGDVPPDAAASLTDPGLRLVDLTPGPTLGQRVAFHAELADVGRDLYVLPLHPLRAGGRYGLVVTTAHHPAVGPCIRPAPLTQALLTGAPVPAPLEPLRGRYQALLAATGLAAADVSAATVFTVAADVATLRAAAADVASRTYTWETPPVCEPVAPGGADSGCARVCEGAFLAYDYRSAGGDDRSAGGDPSPAVDGATPRPTPWRLPVTLWLPAPQGPADAGAPVLLFGHGLDKDRSDAVRTAREVCGLGVAVVAADAVGLGEHPAADPAAKPVGRIAAFLGASLSPPEIDVFALRGHFNQSILDRLQLLALLRQHPDVDGDGAPDLDLTRLFYRGISLGGMLGAGTLALDQRVQAAVLTVVGGRLLDLVIHHPLLADFAAVWRALFGSEAAFRRWLTVAQPAVDLADPAGWAQGLLTDEAGEGGDPAAGPAGPAGAAAATGAPVTPDLLVQLGLTDEIVIPHAGRAFAFALGAPVVGTVGEALDGLPYEPDLPTSGNVVDPRDTAGGPVTAAVFQYDRVTTADGVVEVRHRTLGGSPEDAAQVQAFFGAWLATGLAEVVDPYAVLGTPPLAAAAAAAAAGD